MGSNQPGAQIVKESQVWQLVQVAEWWLLVQRPGNESACDSFSAAKNASGLRESCRCMISRAVEAPSNNEITA